MNAPVFLKLELPWPPSGNRYWRNVNGRLIESSEAKEYKARLKALVPPTPLIGRVMLSGDLHEPDRRRRDLGNCLKVLEDALEGLAYLNDGQTRRYKDLGFADETGPVPGGRVSLSVVGERFATAEEIADERIARCTQRQRAKRTRALKRAAQTTEGGALCHSPAARGEGRASVESRAVPNVVKPPISMRELLLAELDEQERAIDRLTDAAGLARLP